MPLPPGAGILMVLDKQIVVCRLFYLGLTIPSAAIEKQQVTQLYVGEGN